eukprot:TRINITY_DN1244_c0_g1_i1.p1 TRINITY_DN1244_c0_g1~~TRINITY_DN1244_c0_g1_i1.p1  ORF type:complete len:949 (+),score=263.73 TRINITY_DN1244_c0_g1_i1:51-2849(+)
MNQVRKVYEALATDSLNSATKKSMLLLKEHPNSDWAKVVWVDLLLHQNKLEEASVFVDKNFTGAVDFQVLSRITRMCKKLGKDDQLVAICKATWAANQNTRNAHQAGQELFAAYVRHGNLTLQKQFAAELGKKFKEDLYAVWNMVATALGALQDNNAMFFQLTTMMFKRHFQEKTTNEQEVFFYCWFMKQIGKPADALEIIDGEVGKKVVKIEYQRLEKVLELHVAAKNWGAALPILEDLIKNHMDDWKWYEGYLNVIDEVSKIEPEKRQELITIITNLIDEKKAGKEGALKERNPYLACLELEKRLLREGSTTSAEKMEALCVAYFQEFGSKPCCYHDLLPYLSQIPKERFTEFLNSLNTVVSGHEGGNKKKHFDFQSSYFQIRRCLVKPSTAEEAVKEATTFLKLHLDAETLPGEGKDRRPTERGVGDTFSVLSAHYLIDAWSLTNDRSFLITATILLEYCLKQSPTNFQIQILLMRVSGHLGSVQRVYEIFDTMDIRNILCDTVPHLVLPDILRYLGYMEATKIFRLVEKVHFDHESKMSGYIANCYFNAAYAQIDEFSSFKTRLDRSTQMYIDQCESTHLQIMQKGVSKESIVKILESAPLKSISDVLVKTGAIPSPTVTPIEGFLRDNQDWVVMDQWDLTPRKERNGWLWKGLMDEEATTSAHCQKSYYPGAPKNKHHEVLKIRSLQLLLIRDLLVKDEVDSAHVTAYEKILAAAGYQFDKNSENDFDSTNAFAVYFGYSASVAVKEFTTNMKAEKVDTPAILASAEVLEAALSSWSYALTQLQKLATSETDPKIIPRLVATSQSLLHVIFLLSQQVTIIPKSAKKSLTQETKDKFMELKQSLKSILVFAKEFLVVITGHVEQVIPKTAALEATTFAPLLEFNEIIPDVEKVRATTEEGIKSSRKLALTRLQDFLKERSKLLQTVKL